MKVQSKPRLGARRVMSGVAAAAVLSGVALVGVAPAANAAVSSYNNPAPGASLPNGDQNAATGQIYNGSGGGASVTNVVLGSYWLNNVRTFCGEFGVPFDASGTWSRGQDSSQGAARMAWIFANYASTSENDAAKAYASHIYYEGNQDPILTYLAQTPEGAATKALADQMWAASAGHTGKYNVKPQLVLSDAKSGTVENTQVNSATGTVAAQVTLTLSGGAVFDSTGKNVWTGAAGSSPAWHATQTGPVVVTEETQNLVAGWLETYSQPGKQKQLASPGVTKVRGVSADVQATVSFQPQATSTAVVEVKAGETLTDVLHVSAAAGSPWIPGVTAKFDVTWYYSPTKVEQKNIATVPAGATPFAKGQGTATKAGDITVTADKKSDKAGWYYPVASFTKKNQPADQQEFFIGDWKAPFNADGEETLQKFTPQVVTKAADIKNGVVTDSVSVSGNYQGQTLTVVSNLYLTAQCKADAAGTDKAPADAQLVGTVKTDVKGNGTWTTPGLSVPWDLVIKVWEENKGEGCLYWQETVAPTATTTGWTGKHQLPNETVKLTKPTIVTKASENGTVPVTAHDTGVLSGTVPSGEGVVVETKVDQFKFDNSTDGSAQAVCLNPSYTSQWQKVTGPGNITYPSHEIKHEGTYGYVETLKVTVTDKDGKATESILHTGKCGEKDEIVIGFAPNKPVTPEKPVLPNAPKPVVPASVVTQPEVPTGHAQAEPTSNLAGPAAGIGAGVLAALTGVLIMARRRKTADK
ncbi:hypothetical protein [Arthrobacter woluwensis]|uniref:LPXTG-motif cell wall anchor domain-containing protein n=1 Tax=Arthrobacter woluwensis TaxID=156980 RepID=A0A1H4I8N8_9MICC|nr:hypothetical protein [Arthrobacter woluwensis]SEB29485.1 hypothetical protein SAMN04489745_0054 [Arthrobacter woluwensis]SEB30270.1 hypothetical protein SAMN04489745_0127 [Arthrobacter woluwensis]